MRIDMTNGSPLRAMVRFCMPMLLGGALMQLGQLADGLIVGRAVGVGAFAAIAAAAPVAMLATGFLMGLCNGFLLPIALAVGAGDRDIADRCASAALLMTALMAAAVALPAAALAGRLIEWAGTPAELAADARCYLRVAMAGLPVPLITMALSGLMRAEGDTKTPLRFYALSMGLHLALDLLLVVALRLGVAGAAHASLLAQAAACGLFARRVLRDRPGVMRYARFGVRREVAGRLLALGAPIGLTNLLSAAGATALQVAINALGGATVAAVAVAERLYGLAVAPAMAMGGVIEVFSGQNYGAGRVDRVRAGAVRLYALTAALLTPAALLLAAGSGFLVPLWGGGAAASLTDLARIYLIWCALAAPFQCANSILKNLLQGVGMPQKAVIGPACELAVRLSCALPGARALGLAAVCAAHLGGAALSALALAMRCRAALASGGQRAPIHRSIADRIART